MMKQIVRKIANVFVTALMFVATIPLSGRSQTTTRSLAEGKSLYAVNCANCHGDAAQGAIKAGFDISIITERGGKQPPDLTDEDWDYGSTDEAIFKVIKEGKVATMMPAYKGRLSDAQIQNVTTYIRSLQSTQKVVKTKTQKVNKPVENKKLQALELADFIELPISGDMSTDRVTGVLARGSILRDEPGVANRFFINDLSGLLYLYDKQTKKLQPYLNFDGSEGKHGLFPRFTAAMGYAAGLINFVFDPDYQNNGVFYTLHMEDASDPEKSAALKGTVLPHLNLDKYQTTKPLMPPIVPNQRGLREIVLVEWTDKQIGNTTFEGTAREVMRMQLPGIFHPFNEIIFNPTAKAGDADWRVMYLGVGDAGTGERPGPTRLYAQRLDNYQGKILRIIPKLDEHTTTSIISENGQYRIPSDNPFMTVSGAKKEIWAYGLRNPHRLTWYVDPANPKKATLFAFNIGLVSWETIAVIKKGANYGYPLREGSLRMSENNEMDELPAEDKIAVMISDSITKGTVKPVYPVVQYPHDPSGGDAIANGFIYKGKQIPALKDCFVFSDITTGRIWYAKIKDVLAADDGNPLTVAPIYELTTGLRKLTEETYRKRGGLSSGLPGRGAVAGAGRIDIRLAEDNDGELYVLTKGDGMIRKVVNVR